MKRAIFVVAIFASAFVVSCAVHVAPGASLDDSFRATVTRRASFDLSCDSVAAQNIGGDSYGATGCGKRASYTCACANQVASACLQPVCTLDGVTPR